MVNWGQSQEPVQGYGVGPRAGVGEPTTDRAGDGDRGHSFS